MSLAEQQWCPSSVQVTVQQARGLRIKGKGGTNDAYAVMQVGKEKFQTSVVEKSVAPVWREEAAFDLPPLLHQGGGGGGGGKERSTLHVHVLHRALVGPDKLLGQAVVNLLQLGEDRTRDKTEWFKLLDKTGKADKDRGEVLLDIQFMRNNMTASMFDLSATGKSRSRLGKLKDKVRGKKKESDTASNVVPSFTQVLTESDEEGDGEVAAGKGDKKKKHKMKSLFSHKSNLQKNMSQSMSVLTAKNFSLSGSQSSGLNVDSSEGKKKFKFLMHKRSNSSDSKDASSGHQKHGAAEQSNVCINGSHVYCEETQPRVSRIGSNFSLASSGHGSMEDVPESTPPSVDSLKVVRQYSPWTEEEEEELENTKEDVGQLRREEEENIRVEEEMRRKEEERLRRKEEERVRRKEELERLADEKRRQEEEENVEREEEKIRMEEEMRRKEEERVRREEELERSADEKRRREEEERRTEEENRNREEEEKIRREEEEERVKREREECERLAEQKWRLQEQRLIEEERVRKEEEKMLKREEERVHEERKQKEEEMVRRQEEEREEKRRFEEQERSRKEEEERIRVEEESAQEERKRQEEEEKVRGQEEERKLEEKRRLEEEEEERIVEKKLSKEEEDMIRKEEKMAEEERKQREEEEMRRQEEKHEEKRRLEEQERRRREHEERIKKEEEKARREKEEYERVIEEKRKLEEERKRIKAEEKIRCEEEEERIRVEEERREEEERVRRQEEEREQLAEAKRILEEQERRIERERKQSEEKKRREEEENIRKEKEENERLVVQQEHERRRIEKEEKIKREEEERIRREEKAERERKEEEARKLEKEKLTREAEEQKRDNKTKRKAAGKKPPVAVESPAEVPSTNPFDENISNNPFEEIPDSPADSSTAAGSTVQQRVQSAALSVGSKPVSSEEKDPINTQRERRPAPQPPGRNQAERPSQREKDGATQQLAQINKKSKAKDIKTVSVLPQRSVQMIAPLSRSPTERNNTHSLTQSCAPKETSNAAKHSKRTAPPRPSPEQKTAPSSDDNVSHECGSEAKQVSVVSGLNPFEDEVVENAAQDDSTTSGSPGSVTWPPVGAQAADEDAASQAKTKSSKAHAPPLPAKMAATSSASMNQNSERGHVTDATGVTVNSVTRHTRDPASEAASPVRVQEAPRLEAQPAPVQSPGEDAGGIKVVPLITPRRLQPVKPLSPLEQQSVSVVQGVKDNNSTGILCEAQVKTKVKDTGLKGPYSQLTQGELISLVLKQEKQLLERDKKISELEKYIDNLLVRVMEEKPSILMSLNTLKKTA